MISSRWILTLAALAAVALVAAVACASLGAELRIQVDASYYSSDPGSMTMAEQERLNRQSMLASVLAQSVTPLLSSALLVAVAALSLYAHRAGRPRVAGEV